VRAWQKRLVVGRTPVPAAIGVGARAARIPQCDAQQFASIRN
jgi:hypothetical protein